MTILKMVQGKRLQGYGVGGGVGGFHEKSLKNFQNFQSKTKQGSEIGGVGGFYEKTLKNFQNFQSWR